MPPAILNPLAPPTAPAFANVPAADPAPPIVPDFFEVVNGEYREIPHMGARQTLVANLLLTLLHQWTAKRAIGHAVMEMLFCLVPPNVLKRRPDVAFVSSSRWPFDRVVPDEGDAWDVVPNLAVEVVSPTNTVNEIMEKIGDYFAHGVERVWVVLPKQKQIHAYSSPTSIRVYAGDEAIRDEAVLPGFKMSLASIFPPYLC